jgi:hypothetical protein
MTNAIDGETVTLSMTRKEPEVLVRATSGVEYILTNVASIFDMLITGLSMGYIQDDRAVIATMEFASKALTKFTENEGEALGRCDNTLSIASRKEVA